VSITAGGPGAVTISPEPGAREASDHSTERAVHRLRTLPRRERWWALAVALALLAAPVVAVAMFVPDWTPAGDPALMGLRSLDVGTANTPTIGQPSQSRLYAETVHSVHHPGASHFYLMALPIRVLGAPLGMPLVSLLIVGSCLVVAAWAVFRRLGRTAGLVAAAVLALVAFTTGPGSLVNPVSSNIACYPLLATAVLWWCVAAGDVRLLPLATGLASFTAQQHLSVVPATTVLVVGGLAVLAVRGWRAGRWAAAAERRELRRWGLRSLGLGLLLWSPVIAQQLLGDAGNIGEMWWFARHGNSDTLGLAWALRLVANVVGLPPALGRTDLDGGHLLRHPSVVRWVTAAAVLAGAFALCARWRRQGSPRADLGLGLGLALVAGLVNAASVPVGLEMFRITFYHWIWPLSLMVALVYGLAVAPALARLATDRWTVARPALAALAVVAVALPTAVNPALDRRQNRPEAAGSTLDIDVVRRLADAVEAEVEHDRLGDHVMLTSRGEPVYAGVTDALAFELAQRGIEVHFPLNYRFFVNDDRLVDPDRLDGGLVLTFDAPVPIEPPDGGELLTEVTVVPGFDAEAFAELVATATAHDEAVPTPETERFLQELSAGDPELEAFTDAVLAYIVEHPRRALSDPVILAFLRDHPLEQPAFDPETVQRVIDGLAAFDDHGARIGAVRLYLLDEDEMRDVAYRHELPRDEDGG
jgi:hypothetical protein